eukprot:9202757-Pyramimonas_sp.AAC.1
MAKTSARMKRPAGATTTGSHERAAKARKAARSEEGGGPWQGAAGPDGSAPSLQPGATCVMGQLEATQYNGK